MRILFLVLRLLLCTGAWLAACTPQTRRDETTQPDSVVAAAPVTPETEPAHEAAQTAEPATPTAEPFRRSADQLANFGTITAYQPGRAGGELSVRDFTERLGAASEMRPDADTVCPVGQLHFWNLPAQNCRIIALGDAYTALPDPAALCRLYGIQRLDDRKPAAYPGFLDIRLGDEEESVEAKLRAFVQQNPSFRYEQLKGRSAVERLLAERQKSVFLLTNGQRYYHFAIGKRRQLSYILIAGINIREAC